MDRLKALRRPLRAKVTKSVNEAEVELAKENPENDTLQFLLDKMEDSMDKVLDLDQRILDALLDENATVEQQDEEVQSAEEYDDKVRHAKIKINKILFQKEKSSSPTPSEYESVASHTGLKKTYKLPKIQIRKFSGDVTEWLSFWSQFQKIHEDTDLHDADKFQYLMQAMVQDSRARDLVESYPQTAANYPKVIKALEERFGKKKLLKQVYVRELLKMVQVNSTTKGKVDLSSMYTKLESHLRSLESLDVTVEMMATFLFPMVESSLPDDLLIAWQRSPNYGKEDPVKTELDYLMDFLKQEVNAEEQRKLARGESDVKKVSSQPKKSSTSREKFEDEIPTAAGLHAGQIKGCVFCDKPHPSQECFKAMSMTLEDRRSAVMKKKVCSNCFQTGHFWKNCKAWIKCTGCAGKHYHLMCPAGNKIQKQKEVSEPAPQETATNVTSNQSKGNLILLKTLLVNLVTPTGSQTLRVLFDDGSQGSYVKNKCAVKGKCEVIGSRWERNSLFGGVITDVEKRTVFKVPLKSLDGRVHRNLDLPDKEIITGSIPSIPRGHWQQELKKEKIWLTDMNSDNEEIDLLIGADLMPQLSTGKIVKLKCGLIASQTVFGWTLMGPVPELSATNAMMVSMLNVSESSVPDLWKLETLGIQDPAEVMTRQENEAEVKKHFLETVKRNEDGRYCVRLPWVGEVSQNIPSNRIVAEKRLHSTTNKLNRDGRWEEYDIIFKQWEKEDFIEALTSNEEPVACHYLPHRPVYKPESLTTPVRPVFDASCKVGRFPSLNDCLEKGQNFIELIPSIMLRFREKRIGVVSDIRKAFPMVEVNEDDRNYLRFLWWENESCKKVKVFRHKRVVFGVTCSPFLLGAVVEHHLTQVEEKDKSFAEQLLQSLYVDNCITSVNTFEEYQIFKDNTTRIMADARMELRQWECGSVGMSGVGPIPSSELRGCGLDSGSKSIPTIIKQDDVSVLGMKWSKEKDTLRCYTTPEMPEKLSKRTLLSTVQKIFDPMGFLSPAMVMPKRTLQETWAKKLDWDEELPAEVQDKFIKWTQELCYLEQIEIPRNMTGGCISREGWQLHTFTDASQYAYSAIVFLRVEYEDGITVQLLQSKARVAPMKQLTIPRLELLGCTIGSRLANSVAVALDLDCLKFYWSDSTTALAWIKRNDEWGTFVGNRVREICKLTGAENWRHVPGILNPADLPSRGCTPQELFESKWWEGPDWLQKPQSEWPNEECKEKEDDITAEKKLTPRGKVVMKHSSKEVDPWYCHRFSSYHSCVKVIGWIRRFLDRIRKKSTPRGRLTIDEIDAAEMCLFRLVQREVFPSEGKVICGLRVSRDEDKLIRVKTKLLHRKDTPHFRAPILLPHAHPLVERMIREEHLKNGHGGVQFLISRMREKCWIVQTRKAIRAVALSCPRCRRYKSKAPAVPLAPLPENRVKNARVFEVTGVDLAGPLHLKDKTKVWIVLFTCAVNRGVHLELVESLNTDSFLLALFRFVSRRGRPSIIYSDNGTNFVGSNNLFKGLDWDRIQKETGAQRIKWIFNPPSAAWWGGFWERLIQSVKDLLRKMLGFGKLTYIQLLTCLCEVEAVVNARPLTYVTEDPDDLIPLTPAMFMQDQEKSDCPEVLALNAEGLRKKYREFLILKEELRSRFRSEYLGLLALKGKSKKIREFQEGEVVLIASDNKRRIQWPMAKILELLPGKDKEVRTAKVKTCKGELVRPLQRLYPLEVGPDQLSLTISDEIRDKAKTMEKEKQLEPEIITQRGRRIRKPIRLGIN